jgi:alpha-D-ribose 1-methylphosphonate 5-phosphate C-P lyase
MQVKLYEDIARFGHIATTYAYPVKVNGRYVMDPRRSRNSITRKCT